MWIWNTETHAAFCVEGGTCIDRQKRELEKKIYPKSYIGHNSHKIWEAIKYIGK